VAMATTSRCCTSRNICKENIMRNYYSKLQNRFVSRDEYFDELLFSTIPEPFNTTINEKRFIQICESKKK
jgi:hypothetical protein